MPIIAGFEIRGAQQTARRLSRPLNRLLEANASKAGKALLRAAKRTVPKKTGALEKSLKLKRMGKFKYGIVEGKKYGGIIRKGSPPHTIFPRHKKALWGEGLDHPIAKAAHPGFPANEYGKKAARRAQRDISMLTKQFGEAIARHYG